MKEKRMPKYLCVIEPNPEGGFDGYAVDLGVFVVGKDTREEVIESLQEGLALHLLELQEHGREVPPPVARTADVESPGEWVWIEPATINPVSVALEHLLREAKISQAEVARRLGVSRVVVHRMLDPFAPDHKVSSLERIAQAVGKRMEIHFT
jgi:antitoxin HicB